MDDRKRIDEATGTPTVGHEWDGIEELDTPMPRWWLYTLYACIAFSAVYVVLYPAIPYLDSASAGTLGWSSKGELDAAITADNARRGPIRLALAQMPIERLSANPELLHQAEEGGKSAFKVHCVQCHGSGAAGSNGYPNLNDDDWIWGGDIVAIKTTLVNGIRQPGNDATRISQMPAFGRDGILKTTEIDDLVAHVRAISGQAKPRAAAARGAILFVANCAVCHGPDGKGMREFGAPNLADSIWLYGGSPEALTTSISNARGGVMPSWGGRLDPVTIKMLAAYVHSLGGGEALPTSVDPTSAPQQQVAALTAY